MSDTRMDRSLFERPARRTSRSAGALLAACALTCLVAGAVLWTAAPHHAYADTTSQARAQSLLASVHGAWQSFSEWLRSIFGPKDADVSVTITTGRLVADNPPPLSYTPPLSPQESPRPEPTTLAANTGPASQVVERTVYVNQIAGISEGTLAARLTEWTNALRSEFRSLYGAQGRIVAQPASAPLAVSTSGNVSALERKVDSMWEVSVVRVFGTARGVI